ncbi:hypothetical protein Ciccas_002628 [Cichlidogyrus casuarinus]|uniref:VWFA domain-containing protein n=1 Tax=Cichlidogyrus casuarinus TaxID=1844966 RepID=A0ABD2QGP2_9PLAT
MFFYVILLALLVLPGERFSLSEKNTDSNLFDEVITEPVLNSNLEAHVFNWADMIENYIKNLAHNGIRRDVTQTLFDKAKYILNKKDGHLVVHKLSERLTEYFKRRKNAAHAIAHEAQIRYDRYIKEQHFSRDDGISNTKYADSNSPSSLPKTSQNSYFKQKICQWKSTIKIADEVPRKNNVTIQSVDWTYLLESTMLKNHNDAEANREQLRWQYFGTKTGVLRLFPGREWSSNFIGFYDDYDPRTRPWYITATSEPKDVVIVLDCSASMGNTKFGIAKAVANTILNTLTKRDYLNVVCARESAWDDVGKWHHYKPEVLSCQENRLVPATSVFRKDLRSKINDLKPGGTSEFKKGFEKAFNLLKSKTRTQCHSILIFVTDGKDTDGDKVRCGPGYYTRSDVFEKVKELNAITQPPAKIFSYVIMDNHTETLPGKLACDNNGSFTKLTSGQNLISNLHQYYDYLAKSSPNLKKGVWTAPYLDNNGLGVMVTHAVPAFSKVNGFLIGVAGVDLTLNEMDMILMRYLWGSVTGFVIDKEYRTIFHPLMQQGTKLLDDPSFIKIHSLEQDQAGKPMEFSWVAGNMSAGNTGSTHIENGRRGMPKGDYRAGIKYDVMPLDYYYAPIKDSDYSVAFVLAKTDMVYRELEEPENWDSENKSYYNLLIEYKSNEVMQKYPKVFDLLEVKTEEKKYKGLRVSHKYSSIFFSPQCYCDPNEYIFDDNLAKKTLNAHEYMNKLGNMRGDKGCDEGSQYEKGTRAYVLVTHPIEKFWRDRDPELVKNVMWTYVGMRSGVFRTYPGHRSVRDYDPSQRPWYRRTVTSPNKISITTPYMDSAGSGKILTFSQAIFEGMDIGDQSKCQNKEAVLQGGCLCQRNEECMSGSCYVSEAEGPHKNELRCATERIEAITSLDHGYDTFHDKIFELMKAKLSNGEDRDCEAEYKCTPLDSKNMDDQGVKRKCKTKCYLFDNRANVIVDSNFRDVTALDEVKYKGVSLGSAQGEIMLELIYKHKFFERGESIDFQGVCSFTKSEPMVTMNGIPVTPEDTDNYAKTNRLIPKFENSYGCIQDIVSFLANDTKLGNSRMLVGKIYGACISGIYYLTSLKGTNLFLLVIENWQEEVDRKYAFDNFNCRINEKVVASGAHRIINGTCAHNDTEAITLKEKKMCPVLEPVQLDCRYNGAIIIESAFSMTILPVFIALCNSWFAQ